MTTARDTYNQLVYAKEQGLEEGRKEGEAKGREEGLKEGIAKGEEKGKLEIARRMLEMGMDANTIVTATSLSPQEIEALKVQQP